LELNNKIALVTGGGSGLGAAAGKALAAAGAEVILIGRTPHELDKVADAIRDAGGKALTLKADVADESQMQAAFERIRTDYGRLDIVFANAGVNGTWAPIDELTYEEWNKTQSINLGGTFLTAHLSVPLMKQQGGSFIITSSINGTRTFTLPGASAYSTSKAGQLAFGQMLAIELAQYRIRVNVICPGAIKTEIGDNTERRNTERALVPSIFPQGKVPLTKGKPGTSEQVADLVVFLGSDRSSHISGTPIWIDGAQSLLI
jgi:NAD(P)-dependent dehydrogenase (short-subunit alcohol dehydrogenase family)